MATINIRCENLDLQDKLLVHIEEMFSKIQAEENISVDMNYSETVNGGRIIKVKYADTKQ